MNIVYGVSGEGLGHAFEAREIGAALERAGHRLKVLTYGERSLATLSRFSPTRIEGISLQFGRNGMSLISTAIKNAGCIPFYIRNWKRLKKEIAEFKPDVFITAYDPFTTLMAHATRKPLISMDNQNELLFIRKPAGASSIQFRIARLATRVCTYGADRYVIKSFRAGERATSSKASADRARFVSPLIQEDILRLSPETGKHVLVYLTKPNERLIEILQSLPRERFVVYCGGKTGREGNIEYRAPGPNYVEDLRTCKAVIGTTGFSLVNDARFLGKPYFGVPLKKQFEQTYNAVFLQESGMGDFSEDPKKPDIERFLSDLPRYRAHFADVRIDPHDQEKTLLSAIDELVPARSVMPTTLRA
ncbi:MAG: hypothetical protein KGI79_01640 [Patescibacteria group bacterium]|nr:hypothetical protein [Patescibacteria group bacterium]MDE2116559.1 hypothetical protein [Patescibacteria group bacterium]